MHAFLLKVSAALLAYGPWGVLALAIIDSMGIPLPAGVDALLLGVAASSAHSPRTAYFTALLAVIGSVGGNAALFFAARQGNRLISKGESPGKRKRFREWFQRYGLLTVFFPAVVPLVPLPLKVFVISAGAFHTPFGRFIAVIVIARLIRYLSLAYLGLQLGLDAQGFLTHNGWRITGVALALAFLLVAAMRLLDRRKLEVHN
jgi:membrane protein YqaA with SNARE-associated domain